MGLKFEPGEEKIRGNVYKNIIVDVVDGKIVQSSCSDNEEFIGLGNSILKMILKRKSWKNGKIEV